MISRTQSIWVGLSFAISACSAVPQAADDADNSPSVANEAPHQPSAHEQVAKPATAEELSAPTLSSALKDGRCESQADCPANDVCMAVMPGDAECVPASYAGAAATEMEKAPNGRPAPPIGLLDGQVLRDHVMRESKP